jgi:hypothetical protein
VLPYGSATEVLPSAETCVAAAHRLVEVATSSMRVAPAGKAELLVGLFAVMATYLTKK